VAAVGDEVAAGVPVDAARQTGWLRGNLGAVLVKVGAPAEERKQRSAKNKIIGRSTAQRRATRHARVAVNGEHLRVVKLGGSLGRAEASTRRLRAVGQTPPCLPQQAGPASADAEKAARRASRNF
jgi:hypothetical protein